MYLVIDAGGERPERVDVYGIRGSLSEWGDTHAWIGIEAAVKRDALQGVSIGDTVRVSYKSEMLPETLTVTCITFAMGARSELRCTGKVAVDSTVFRVLMAWSEKFGLGGTP